MIGNLWRAPIIKIAADRERYEIEGVAFGVATLVMESSQGLDPWIDGSKSLLYPMTRSQNPWTVWVRAVQMEGVREPPRTPSMTPKGGRGTIDWREENSPRRRSWTVGGRHRSLLRRHAADSIREQTSLGKNPLTKYSSDGNRQVESWLD